MKIGVKFCGGCKVSYDRKAFLEEIKSYYGSEKFEFVKSDQEYDVVIVLNSCQVACGDVSKITSKRGFVQVWDNDLDSVIRKMEETKQL